MKDRDPSMLCDFPRLKCGERGPTQHTVSRPIFGSVILNSPTDTITAPEQPFDAPWHAELFATTHALARAKVFDWPDWSDHFARALAEADHAGAPKDGSTYYEIWLEALEVFLVQRSLAEPDELARLKKAWTESYLSTPHGAPVELGHLALQMSNDRSNQCQD